MDMINNTSCCDNCPNNRKNNPYASGICCCALPYIGSTFNQKDYITTTSNSSYTLPKIEEK